MLAADCTLCTNLPSKFNCLWCDNGCHYGPSCRRRAISADPIHKESRCPAPTINSISPISGPLAGGTLITIEGRDLVSLSKPSDSRITVSGQTCKLMQIMDSRRITCLTSFIDTPLSGDVIVMLHNGKQGVLLF